MATAEFLLQSSAAADLRVGHPLVEPPDSDASIEAVIETLDAQARLDGPGRLPPLDLPAALWAARLTYGLAQTLVFREIAAEAITAVVATPCPAAATPAVCYSADLAFCLLPDLYRLAGALSRDDPLTLGLATLGRAWPLSSVGMNALGPVDPGPFWDDDALRRLYVDRVLERGDVRRADDPRVRAAVSAALGAHRSLAPLFAIALDAPSPSLETIA